MGKCYSVNTPLQKDDRSTLSSITGAVTKPFIESVKDLLYYDDPVFTFEDSLLYGCTVELNQAELASFCKNREWIHLMIYQNLFQLEKFGTSGDSTPEFERDWAEVKVPIQDDQFELAANEGADDVCNLPSIRIIEVFYSKINTFEDPQYTIEKVQHYSVKKK